MTRRGLCAQAAYPMAVIVLVSIDRTRGDGWEGTLLGGAHDGSMHFVNPGLGDTGTTHVIPASSMVVGQGDPGAVPSLGLSEARDNEGEGGMDECMCMTP